MTKQYAGRPHRDRATFVSAGQPRSHKFVSKSPQSIRGGSLPRWLPTPKALDYLDHNNPFFFTDRALFSIGHDIHGSVPQGMFSPRQGVTILGDSGGFQLLTNPALWRGDATRHWVLTALEHHTDEAMTLDIPSRGIAAGTPWPTFDHALQITVDNLRYFDRHRVGRTRFLNVLQGETRDDALRWLNAVKWFDSGGWAFGGKMRENFAHLVDVLVKLANQNMLVPARNRIHVLGMADLTAAVALSAIQRGMRKRLNDDDLLITFDVSSASKIAANRQAYGLPYLSKAEFRSTGFGPQTILRPERVNAPFPARHTAIGSRLRMGDLCVRKTGSLARTAWDELSEELIVHHNTEALFFAIDAANSVVELHPTDATDLAPAWVINAYQALYNACLADDPLSYLRPAMADVLKI
ncbi:hypothetical protein F1C10_00295 [Sphingomonas sp. NBWT7]|uniref:hypothetical protein n=1 Tax=Sphingomonas sp. NBWT7 TaxID=2596913 RepID=UPI0016284C39|nr:hypothetical protein [Sphingomonas sp. NBWT7]QNE30580.1 hypothetical protein F1C10_00295 [Sphingomonas sp. NBWT7]